MDLNLHSSSSSSSSEETIYSSSSSDSEAGNMMSYASNLIRVDRATLECGIIPVRGTANKRFRAFKSRFDSFFDWPPGLRQRPKELAEAGFYYQGVSDEVHCFKCAGSLKRWDENDLPWTEHAKHFPLCSHLRLVMGDNFVKEAQKLEKFSKKQPAAATPEFQEIPIPDDFVCKVCMAQEITTVFMPCGHFFTCGNCALQLHECSICRKPIKAYTRSYRV